MTALPDPVSDPDSVEREERRRVLKVYGEYDGDPRYLKRWAHGPGARFMRERKWSLLALAVRESRIDVRSARVLDIGCGTGEDSASLLDLGFAPSRLVLMDLRIDQAAGARRHPEIGVVGADAARLPFRDATFDVVYQSTMLSSVLDSRVRSSILAEVARVLIPGGLFLSYDTRYPNPWNRRTRPLRRREIGAAVPGWSLRTRSVTAVPQILRVLAPLTIVACRVLEALPPLRCHLVVAAVKPGGDPPGESVA